MPEPSTVGAAISAGVLLSGGTIALGAASELRPFRARVDRLRSAADSRLKTDRAGRWLSRSIERAGWRETPERIATMAVALGCSLGVAGWALAPVLAPVGFTGGCALVGWWVRSAARRRGLRLAAELVPLLELFTLELSGGGSPLAALGSVTVQVEGEMASDLRRMLIASQVAGSVSFESRLLEYSDRNGLAALASLATLLAASREYGTATSQGVRALATDLRRAQRRDLISHSRRALNLVLLPAAVTVLLPFLGILMFPALSVLERSLR